MKTNVISKRDFTSRGLVIQRAINREITQAEAAEEIGITERQVRRLVRRFRKDGLQGLAPRYKGGNNRLSDTVKEEAISLVSKYYKDFGPKFACEKLKENHNLHVSRETLRKWMMEAGIWKGVKRRKARIHQSRERRGRFGELVQIDGSHHDWFEGRAPKCCLIVMIDDATSQLIHMQFEESETTLGYMRATEAHLRKYGRPAAYYSDKHSIFRKNHKGSTKCLEPTQFNRALNDLDITLICAHSPQAKGRVERANKTLQDRLVKEMRLLGISSMEEGNKYLCDFMEKHNKKFSVPAAKELDAHRPIERTDEALMLSLSKRTTHRVTKNLEFSHDNKIFQLSKVGSGHRLRQASVMVHETCHGETHVIYNKESLPYKVFYRSGLPLSADSKEVNATTDRILEGIIVNGFGAQPPTIIGSNSDKGCELVDQKK